MQDQSGSDCETPHDKAMPKSSPLFIPDLQNDSYSEPNKMMVIDTSNFDEGMSAGFDKKETTAIRQDRANDQE
jgi:hypothetical protein